MTRAKVVMLTRLLTAKLAPPLAAIGVGRLEQAEAAHLEAANRAHLLLLGAAKSYPPSRKATGVPCSAMRSASSLVFSPERS